MGQLNFPLDSKDKAILKEAVKERLGDVILDTVWDDYFYYMTFFESLDGWNGTNFDTSQFVKVNKGVSFLTSGIIQVSAGPTDTNGTQIDKSPLNQPILTYDRVQRFRTQVKAVTINEIDAFIVIGDDPSLANKAHYGFQIEENTLRGLCGDGTATNATIDLLTLSGGENLVLEARLLPKEKITFYVSTTGMDGLKERGTLTTPIPTGGMDDSLFSTWASILAVAKSNVADKGDWATATSYVVDDVVYSPGLNLYFICKNNHTSGSSTEPGIGGSWENEWEYFGIHLSFFEYIQRKPKKVTRQFA